MTALSSVLFVLIMIITFACGYIAVALWYARRLRRVAEQLDPLWYTPTDGKSTPLGYYSAQHHRRIVRTEGMKPRG